MRRILVLRGGALGDFIVTLPTLELLRKRWPRARIELVGNATAAQLAVARGILHAVHSQHEARWSTLFAPLETPLAADFAAWLAHFDLVVSYWPDPDGELARRFPITSQQTFISAAAQPTIAPAAAHYAEALRGLGIPLDQPFTTISPLTAQPLRPQNEKPISIHPGSGSLRKNWPQAKWRELLNHLPGSVQVILGEAEVERNPPTESTWPNARILLQPSLEELVTALASSRLFLGHDSGVSHLAAACGVPCVLLFGPTDPAMWAPPVPGVRVERAKAALTDLTVNEVAGAANTALAGLNESQT